MRKRSLDKNMIFWIKNVKSGDTENHKSRAAVYYWDKLFPKVDDFTLERFGDSRISQFLAGGVANHF